jgi:hypothetical protein
MNELIWNDMGVGGSLELTDGLLNAGASACLKARPLGTPLHVLMCTPGKPTMPLRAIATLLVRWGAEVDAIDYDGRSPLMLAARVQPAEIVQALLDLGADANAVNATGATPLHYALWSEEGRGDVVRQLLLNKGTNGTARDKCGRSALYLAVMTASGDLPTFTAVLDVLPAAERGAHLAEAIPAALKAGSTAVFEAIMQQTDSMSTYQTGVVGRPWTWPTATGWWARRRCSSKGPRARGPLKGNPPGCLRSIEIAKFCCRTMGWRRVWKVLILFPPCLTPTPRTEEAAYGFV